MNFVQKTPYQRIADGNEIWCVDEKLGGKVMMEKELVYGDLMRLLLCSSEKGDMYLVEVKDEEEIIAKIERETIEKMRKREITTTNAFKTAEKVFVKRNGEVREVSVKEIKRKLPEKGVLYTIDLPLKYDQQYRMQKKEEKRNLRFWRIPSLLSAN